MGILSRISRVLESNLNSLIERAEDPAKLLDQAIEDMRRGQRDAREAIVEAKTQKRLLERRIEKARNDASSYESKAVRALEGGDEELARRALELKLAAEERADAEGSAVLEQQNQIDQLEAAERELGRRLAEMPAKRAALLARQAAAEAKGARVGQSSKAKSSVSNALQAFDRMEEKVIRAEVQAEVVGEQSPDLLDAGADHRMRTEDAFQALKAKVAAKQITSGAAEPPVDVEIEPDESAPPSSAVDDSLAELKKKLQKD